MGQASQGLPGLLLGLTVAAEVGSVVLSWGLESAYDTALYFVFSVAMGGTRVLIARRHPSNAFGWLFCWSALFNALSADLSQGWGLRAAERPAGVGAETTTWG